jgi:hypothetical protein
MEWTKDEGETWERTEALNTEALNTETLNDGEQFGAIQPSILRHGDGKCRSFVEHEGWGTFCRPGPRMGDEPGRS